MSLRVVITGASSGIGEALAVEYARRGARLGLIARRGDRLRALSEKLRVDTALFALDVRDSSALQRAARDYCDRFGGADVVVASAGVGAGTLTERAEDRALFQEILDINVMGTVNTFQPFVAAMRAAGGGTLVGIASVAGFRGLPGSGAYCASKAAVIAYLEALRVELRGTGVAVVTISPGYIATPMTEKNPYPMPFLMRADRAAKRMVDAIERRTRHIVVPWQMGVVGLLLKMMPRPVHDAAFARAPRKPRREAG
ncbi:MAG TPA: SDR family oxidoreductase [Burkholderiales bacterium]|nr:SDR family oxidoreductase [Burkholderiales bacterium]